MKKTNITGNTKNVSPLNFKELPPGWLVPINEFCEGDVAIDWLIEGYIQCNSTNMLFGASGVGKTFIDLSMGYVVAGGNDTWFGHSVKHGYVVYFAGEGYAGLKRRLLAISQTMNPDSREIKMSISRRSFDLDDIENTLKYIIQELDSLPEPPIFIIIDPLFRFMYGDENSSQDTRAILKSAEVLQQRYNCTVLFVHHTGNSHEAQNRARGSSAWKGALDSEMLVKRDKDDLIILEHTKSKDTFPMPEKFFVLESVNVQGKKDENGEPVNSAILVEYNASTAENRNPFGLTKKEQENLDLFIEAVISDNEPFDIPCVTKENFKKVLIKSTKNWKSLSNDRQRQVISRAISPLVKKGVLEYQDKKKTLLCFTDEYDTWTQRER